jgi:glycosyltransferase involved in cell wall biosynthesis
MAQRLHGPYRRVGATIFRRARQVICVSNAEQVLVERDFPGTRGRIVVVPNGVDVGRIRAAEPVHLGGRVILAVGRLEPYKRVPRLVEAVSLLPEDVRLLVVGRGPDRDSVIEAAALSGASDRVEVLGGVDDDTLYGLLRRADVVVSLSTDEAFGMTLYEGLAAGARVLASAIPAHSEVVGGRQGAALVPVDAPIPEIAFRLTELMAESRPSLDEVGVWSWGDVGARTLELYATLLGHPA